MGWRILGRMHGSRHRIEQIGCVFHKPFFHFATQYFRKTPQVFLHFVVRVVIFVVVYDVCYSFFVITASFRPTARGVGRGGIVSRRHFDTEAGQREPILQCLPQPIVRRR